MQDRFGGKKTSVQQKRLDHWREHFTKKDKNVYVSTADPAPATAPEKARLRLLTHSVNQRQNS